MSTTVNAITTDSFFESNKIYQKNDQVELTPNLLDDSPEYNFHTDVLDSVFSTDNLDERSVDHTPMFDELDLVLDGTTANSKEDWISLFEAEDEVDNNLVVKDEDLLQSIEPIDLAMSEASSVSNDQLLTPNPSSTLSTPLLDASKKRKVDHLGVIKYSKKQRSQPLQPIKVTRDDPVLMKRAKNTEAARRSRARKMERMKQLEDKVEELMTDKLGLNDEITRLKQLLDANHVSY